MFEPHFGQETYIERYLFILVLTFVPKIAEIFVGMHSQLFIYLSIK
jgi:hypothetical protein